VRFSNSTGLPQFPDNNPKANPRGLAVRFHLAERVHTDIISHATDGFPTRTGDEFLEFLQAAAASAAGGPSPTPIEAFLGTHPAALAFVQTPKPSPSSFAREQYYGVTAMQFTNAAGVSRYGRYRIVPDAGVDHLDDAAFQSKGPTFLFDELKQRVEAGPVSFQIHAQLAGDGDIVDDATSHWPEDRSLVHLGGITLTGLAPDDAQQQKRIIFDPVPRVDGIEPSADPLIEVRAAVYLLSGRQRREAPE
jgi:catalase